MHIVCTRHTVRRTEKESDEENQNERKVCWVITKFVVRRASTEWKLSRNSTRTAPRVSWDDRDMSMFVLWIITWLHYSHDMENLGFFFVSFSICLASQSSVFHETRMSWRRVWLDETNLDLLDLKCAPLRRSWSFLSCVWLWREQGREKSMRKNFLTLSTRCWVFRLSRLIFHRMFTSDAWVDFLNEAFSF